MIEMMIVGRYSLCIQFLSFRKLYIWVVSYRTSSMVGVIHRWFNSTNLLMNLSALFASNWVKLGAIVIGAWIGIGMAALAVAARIRHFFVQFVIPTVNSSSLTWID